MTLEICAEDRGDRLDIVAQVQCRGVDLPLAGAIAQEVDLDEREIVDVEFAHDRLFRRRGNLRLAAVHGLAHINEGRVEVVIRVEFHEQRCVAFRGEPGDFLDAFDLAQLYLHRLHQETLRVLG
jgi:predicted transcriptional regulator